MPLFLLFFALFFWIGGYLMVKKIVPLPTNSMFEMEKVIFPPKWFFYLCGAPKSTTYLYGTLPIGAFRAQIAGLVFGIFSLLTIYWKPTQDGTIIGLGICLLIPLFISSWVSKNRPAKPLKNHKPRKS